VALLSWACEPLIDRKLILFSGVIRLIINGIVFEKVQQYVTHLLEV